MWLEFGAWARSRRQRVYDILVRINVVRNVVWGMGKDRVRIIVGDVCTCMV